MAKVPLLDQRKKKQVIVDTIYMVRGECCNVHQGIRPEKNFKPLPYTEGKGVAKAIIWPGMGQSWAQCIIL